MSFNKKEGVVWGIFGCAKKAHYFKDGVWASEDACELVDKKRYTPICGTSNVYFVVPLYYTFDDAKRMFGICKKCEKKLKEK